MKFILFFLFLFYVWLTDYEVTTATLVKNGSRIIGGDIAFAGQFPHLAAVYKTTNEGRYFCGGSLLDNQWILTSASCVDGATLFEINLGLTNLNNVGGSNTLRLATDEYLVHPSFNPSTLENDVGLIKLRLPITFNTYIRPVNYLPDYELLPGTPGVVAMGWGQISDDDPGLVDELRFVYLTPLSNDECKQVYGEQIVEHMVCAAGNNNEGFCLGDSGTPLIQIRNGPTSTHMGIASFISQNGCESPDPSGYTRTLDFVDWIRNATGINK